MAWGWGPWPGHMAWYGGSWWLGALMPLLFWGLFIGGAIWLVRALTKTSSPGEEPSRAMAILEERLARGEITLEQFRQLREELRQARRS